MDSSEVESESRLDLSRLTEKEKEVAALMIAGLPREKIATLLNLSENTVKTHIKGIYRKIPAELAEYYRAKNS